MSEIKIIFAVVSSVIIVASLPAYLKDIFARRTQPHAYTWLIWSITQGMAAAGLWYGGGGAGVLSVTVGTIFVVTIFFISLKYGTLHSMFKCNTQIKILHSAFGN